MEESFKILKKTIIPITILFLVLCIIILPAFAVAIAYGNFKIIQKQRQSLMTMKSFYCRSAHDRYTGRVDRGDALPTGEAGSPS